MSEKILLVNPPFYILLVSHYNANSLDIAGIAAYLNQHGHDAWLYNADSCNFNGTIDQRISLQITIL